jgi:ankyrin repeat protein
MDGIKLWKNIGWKSFILGICLLGTAVQAKNNKQSSKEAKKIELAIAASKGDKTCIKILVKNNTNVNARLFGNRTTLHEAALSGLIATMRALLNKGANPNLQDDEGNSALHFAAFGGSVIKVKLLLDFGADLNIRDTYGRTPLMRTTDAVLYEAIERAKEKSTSQKKKKKQIKASWEKKHNPNSYFKIIRQLVNCGADVNTQDNEGRTALHYAGLTWPHWAAPKVPPPTLHRQPQVTLVQILTELGADPTIKDNYGETPLDIFEQSLPPATPEEIDRANAKDILPEYRTEYKHRAEISELLGGTVGESSSEAEDSEN